LGDDTLRVHAGAQRHVPRFDPGTIWAWFAVAPLSQADLGARWRVSDDLTDMTGFAKEFCEAHRCLSSVSAARWTREALEKWPTPKHSDDKTIACLFREEVVDE